uniref:Transposase n=1 Tax=Bursaphelenchus xylophilus TaxID=6326 RepID=A0A1I7S0L1_BURXY
MIGTILMKNINDGESPQGIDEMPAGKNGREGGRKRIKSALRGYGTTRTDIWMATRGPTTRIRIALR